MYSPDSSSPFETSKRPVNCPTASNMPGGGLLPNQLPRNTSHTNTRQSHRTSRTDCGKQYIQQQPPGNTTVKTTKATHNAPAAVSEQTGAVSAAGPTTYTAPAAAPAESTQSTAQPLPTCQAAACCCRVAAPCLLQRATSAAPSGA
jgi:hypothetical protein